MRAEDAGSGVVLMALAVASCGACFGTECFISKRLF